MRSFILLMIGIIFGVAIQTTIAQTQPAPPNFRLNHVAMRVTDLGAALKYYQDKLGFLEVTRMTNPTGEPLAAYIQVSRDTFIELAQADAQHPAGLDHFGLETADIKTTAAALRQRGLTVSDPIGPTPLTGGYAAGITDANVGRIELTEQPLDGKLRKAAAGWK